MTDWAGVQNRGFERDGGTRSRWEINQLQAPTDLLSQEVRPQLCWGKYSHGQCWEERLLAARQQRSLRSRAGVEGGAWGLGQERAAFAMITPSGKLPTRQEGICPQQRSSYGGRSCAWAGPKTGKMAGGCDETTEGEGGSGSGPTMARWVDGQKACSGNGQGQEADPDAGQHEARGGGACWRFHGGGGSTGRALDGD